ncbi:DctP family TRAP transporter solute-binding subunit [Microbacterium sp.]|uniref:DctP family TRAP transporter solute-binding subunit n=1 Tax=Microbacterium sp. TaxID=51671 RepID=UPI002CA8672D|nr:DctP family TRAP transporter solute-binding subunit [Microbacterium sp.]HWK77749.1 DctP family TRAP transporter solute-binding subunit [Microbacterium sp.]
MRVPAKWVACIALVGTGALAVSGCSAADSADGGDGQVTIDLASSYNDDQPQNACGAAVIKEVAEAADVGLTVDVYPSSQLGGDTDRVAAIASGDIDMDIQGSSTLAAIYEPISVMDAAYVFDGPEHLAAFVASDDGKQLLDDFEAATGIRSLGVWSAGARQFTSNEPISEPADLAGKRMRFPGSPQYLLNAQALGAQPTEIAYEEVYLALQQGTADGQENPITNIDSLNLQEVQDYINLTSHQLTTHHIIIGKVWDELTDEQRAALQDGVDQAVVEEEKCVEEEEAAKIKEWKDSGVWQVNDDVDVDAFRDQAISWFEDNLTGDKLRVFESIRATAE